MKIFGRILWPTRLKRALTAAELFLLSLLVLAGGSFAYCLGQYIALYTTANQATRSLRILAKEADVEQAVAGWGEKVQAVFPDYAQYFGAEAALAAGETTLRQDVFLYGASGASLPQTLEGRKIDFSADNEVLAPSRLVVDGAVRDGGSLIGRELTLSFPVFRPLPDGSGMEPAALDTVTVRVVGSYDSGKNVTAHDNAFFAPEALVKKLYERSVLENVGDTWYIQGRLPQTVLVADTMQAQREIRADLAKRGYEADPVFAWDGLSIGLLAAIAGITVAASLIAAVVLTLNLWKETVRSQARELGILYTLGCHEGKIARLLQKQYGAFLIVPLAAAACLAQIVIAPVGRHLMEGYIRTTVFNPVSAGFLVFCAVFSALVIQGVLHGCFAQAE